MLGKVFKTLVVFSDGDPAERHLVDTVFINDAWWLVGEWYPSHAKGAQQPRRLIRLTGLDFEENFGPFPYRFVLKTGVPKAVLDGEKGTAFEVVELPAPAGSQGTSGRVH